MYPRRLPDLSGLSDAQARRLLATYGPAVRKVAALFPRLDRDEALAVGQDAVLEAYLSHDPTQATEATWVRRLLHWRLAEAAARDPWDRHVESLDPDPQVLNGAGPEEAFFRASAVHNLGSLSVRHQMILDGRMRDETYREIGQSIGISTQLTQREGQKALRVLRSLLEGE